MTCIKTGAHVFLEEYGEWAYGDVHLVNGVHILRVAQVEFSPIYLDKHFTFHAITNWWKDKPYGTIIASFATNHGYNGVLI